MKYSDLPKAEVTRKLIATCFDEPTTNLYIYKLYISLKDHQQFIENERMKLLEKYGISKGDGFFVVPKERVKEYQQKLSEVLNIEITDTIPFFNLSEDNFITERCNYAKEQEMWLSAEDIAAILGFIDKLKHEKNAG